MKEKPSSLPIRILLADGYVLVAAGLRLLLNAEPGMTVIGEAHTKSDALQSARQKPDIILLDLNLGPECGVDFLPELIAASVKGRVLILTEARDPDLHLRAVFGGAMGVVSKLEKPEILIKAIRKVHAGEAWMNRAMMASAMAEIHTRSTRKPEPEAEKISSLTPREHAVINLIAEGRRNKQIAGALYIAEKTVRHHLTSIFVKLGVSDRLELMLFAYQHGLAKLPASPKRSPALVQAAS